MRKKQDIMWEQSTLWESVEKWVTKYLKKSHSEYRELQVKAMRIVEENPALRILMNSMEGIVLTPKDHKALHKYIETKDEMTIFEYEYYYLAGQIMTFSYGRMLAQVNCSATELPEHLNRGGIPPFSGCVHDTTTVYSFELYSYFYDFRCFQSGHGQFFFYSGYGEIFSQDIICTDSIRIIILASISV